MADTENNDYPKDIQQQALAIMRENGIPSSSVHAHREFNELCEDIMAARAKGERPDTPTAERLAQAANMLTEVRYTCREALNGLIDTFERQLLHLADTVSPLPTAYCGTVIRDGIATVVKTTNHPQSGSDFAVHIGPKATTEETLEFLQKISDQIKTEGIWRGKREQQEELPF